MYCTYCKMARAENEAPCSNCGAPSPLFQHVHYNGEGTGNASGAAFGGSGTAGAAFGEQWEAAVPQLSFDDSILSAPGVDTSTSQSQQSSTPPWQQPSQFAQTYNAMPTWQQPGGAHTPTPPWQPDAWSQTNDQHATQESASSGGQAGPPSLLPVPYEPGRALQTGERRSTISLQLVPDHAIQHLLQPHQSLGEMVYVAPMYTKPRPIVPKYRVVSGLLSIILMALVVCAGAGYYAQTQGVLARAARMVTGAPPKSLPIVSSSTIPDPPEQTNKDLGPAYNAIPSAVTTLNIDKNNLARQPAKIFKPGQVFYLVFSVQAPSDGKGGKVHTKWYTNDKFFTEIMSQEMLKPGDIKSGNIQMRFTAPLSGRVELYWNDQFAQRLYFAVK